MKITPIISNEIEIEHEGIILKVHCSTDTILVSNESEDRVEYPLKYPMDSGVDERTIKFLKRRKNA